MSLLTTIILVTGAIALLAFTGVLFVAFGLTLTEPLIKGLVSLASGTLLGGAFFHLIPESMENTPELAPYGITGGLLLFLMLENVLKWQHDHHVVPKTETFATMSLLGDGLHNFIDGVVISAAFLVSFPLGLTTSLAVAAHEIPQEMGDFGVLVRGGFSVKSALFYNGLTASAVVAGAVLTYFLSDPLTGISTTLIPVAAGGFIYVAASDLLPELRDDSDSDDSLIHLALIILGISVMVLIA